MIWSIINAKGGVGKTTAAILLAAALHETGRMVRVKDADPSRVSIILGRVHTE